MRRHLYAKADGNRPPWFIVAIKIGSIHDFRIVKDGVEQAQALLEFNELYGLTNCKIYIGEGFSNIQR